jgi:hypothetical protein
MILARVVFDRRYQLNEDDNEDLDSGNKLSLYFQLHSSAISFLCGCAWKARACSFKNKDRQMSKADSSKPIGLPCLGYESGCAPHVAVSLSHHQNRSTPGVFQDIFYIPNTLHTTIVGVVPHG